jgi:hypothetical protein
MNLIIKTILTLLLASFALAACSSTPSPYNSPDDQRSRSKDAQDEMRRDTSRY